MDSYNSATASLESRVLVSARRFSELQAAPADLEIVSVEPIELVPRKLQAMELLPRPSLTDPNEQLDEIGTNAGEACA